MRFGIACLATVVSIVVLFCPVYGQFNFVKYAGNPVIPYWSESINDPSGYKYTGQPSVIYDSAHAIYRMMFSSISFNYGATWSGSNAISIDGLRWYVDIKNPVLPPGTGFDFDEGEIRGLRILPDGNGYRMYYMGLSTYGVYAIGVATSPDGVTWQKYASNPVLTNGPNGAWDQSGALFEDVLHKDTMYYMWYTGTNASGVQGIGLATSTDGYQWTKYAGNPVFSPATSGWDNGLFGAPAVTTINGMFYMFYLGANDYACCHASVGVAYSSDGINWTRYDHNPILVPTLGWDDQSMGGLSPIVRGQKVYLYYDAQSSMTGHWQIGLAISDITTGSVKPQQAGLPEKSSLAQSFPNPFNPVARIHYDLVREGPVSLKIYDILGREVATLVNETKHAGRYDVEWNATDFPSGTYIYKLTAGTYVESRKMVLVK